MPNSYFHRADTKEKAFKKYLRKIDDWDYESKYGNKKTTIDGIEFDSKKEARRYEQLKLLLAANQIKSLEIHKVFQLQSGFRDIKNKWIRPITYESDFSYEDLINHCYVVEDVKGYKTDKYLIKKKLFLFKYREYDFRET